jgi:hypothetical protein
MCASQDTDQRNGGVLSRVPAKPRLMPSRAGAVQADLSSDQRLFPDLSPGIRPCSSSEISIMRKQSSESIR